jgi:hypothetical protein
MLSASDQPAPIPRKKGRPTKFTPEIVRKFLRNISRGMTNYAAALLAGTSQGKVHDWMAKGREATSGPFYEFWKAYNRAKARSQAKMVVAIQRAGRQDWRALAWLLERQFPQDFALKQVIQQTDAEGNTVQNATSFQIVFSLHEPRSQDAPIPTEAEQSATRQARFSNS